MRMHTHTNTHKERSRPRRRLLVTEALCFFHGMRGWDCTLVLTLKHGAVLPLKCVRTQKDQKTNYWSCSKITSFCLFFSRVIIHSSCWQNIKWSKRGYKNCTFIPPSSLQNFFFFALWATASMNDIQVNRLTLIFSAGTLSECCAQGCQLLTWAWSEISFSSLWVMGWQCSVGLQLHSKVINEMTKTNVL